MKIWNYESNDNDRLSHQLNKDNDIAYTNPEMGKFLISTIDFKPGDIVMEPCYGKGAFFENLPDYTINKWCEINMGRDYLKNDEIVDITISNPPFVPRKLFWEFNLVAMKNTRREIYWLINMSSLNVLTPNRLEVMNNMGWYLDKMTIVSDKRWFGRYVFIKLSRTNRGFIDYTKKIY